MYRALVSVFDSSVQGGDAVWEGLRVYDYKVCVHYTYTTYTHILYTHTTYYVLPMLLR